MKTLFLARDSQGTSILGWSFDSEEDAYECAEINGYKANEITEILCPDYMKEFDFNSCATIAEYQEIVDDETPELVKLLIKNGYDWYVCHTEDGEFELKHRSLISNIIECGHNCKDYGYTKIERCWNGVDLSDETHW